MKKISGFLFFFRSVKVIGKHKRIKKRKIPIFVRVMKQRCLGGNWPDLHPHEASAASVSLASL